MKNKTNVKTEVQLITPELAKVYLKKVDEQHQRKTTIGVIKSYANAMSAGHWCLTHQGIAFDERSRLIDGRHRLSAVIESNTAVYMNVTKGLPEVQASNGIDVFTIDAIDRGHLRQVGQQLVLRHGYTNGNVVAGAARCIQLIASGGKKNGVRMTIPIALEILKIYGNSIQKLSSNNIKMPGLGSSYFVGAISFCLNARGMKEKINEFYNECATGENISKEMPSYTLRQHFFRGGHADFYAGGSSMGDRVCNSTCLAAMYFVENKKLSMIKNTKSGVEFFLNKQKHDVEYLREKIGAIIKP